MVQNFILLCTLLVRIFPKALVKQHLISYRHTLISIKYHKKYMSFYIISMWTINVLRNIGNRRDIVAKVCDAFQLSIVWAFVLKLRQTCKSWRRAWHKYRMVVCNWARVSFLSTSHKKDGNKFNFLLFSLFYFLRLLKMCNCGNFPVFYVWVGGCVRACMCVWLIERTVKTFPYIVFNFMGGHFVYTGKWNK